MSKNEHHIQQIKELEQSGQECRIELEHLRLLLEEERAKREAAEKDSKDKSNFVAVLSHEIRNPVNGIVAMSELLSETELTEEQNEYLKIIRGSNESLLELVNGILDMSRLEAGKMTIAHNPFDLINTIEDLIYMLAPRAFDKNVEVVLDVESEIPLFVVGDVVKVRQIFLNLLQNAIKFTHEGEIVFQLKRMPSLEPDRIVVGFAVRDTGIGMSEEQLTRIFDVYTQVHEASIRHYDGAGLGLNITKNLIELLGGRIEVTSTAEEGTTVEILLSFERYTDLPSIPFEDDVLSGMKLLVIDREETSRSIIAGNLGGWGASVESAADMDEELAKRAGDGAFDLLLADRSSVDGNEHFRTLMENPRPHAFLLARLGEKVEDEERSRFRSIVTKPIRKLHLLNAILAMNKNSRG
ncbi:hypothetical protein CDO73_12570 [Saccharibacillus sp. O23]|uniref:ATP-binding response regulator n=1 Tax=Saccharibacillus sp. O23 TaxID=2009338 RepID=UPI000B4E7FD0|nr:ATP-binding protein [Saccharibacillus sp. O23]OWR29910.1 hypothetical protein CDO73_12570 [Saccharibacillus sp. O23]